MPTEVQEQSAGPVLPTGIVVLAAVTVSLCAWTRTPRPALLVAAGVLLAVSIFTRPAPGWHRSLGWLILLGLIAVAGSWRAQDAWEGVRPDRLGRFEGWVRVVDDPQPYSGATRVIVEAEGERFEIWARGRAQQQRVGQWRGGEQVRLAGERVALEESRARRVAWQHVVGELAIEWAADVDPGAPLARASNRVRGAIERSVAHLPPDQGALFRGLVVGDDRDQSPEMVERFRASGLSHLTAVSGQNVAYLLAAAGPVLCRLRPAPRLMLTLVLIGWFVSLTRFEPSIVRAGTMAALAATAFLLGADRTAVRNLGLAVTVLVLVDPLIAGSVGFWLSVGATAGVTVVGPFLTDRLGWLRRLASPVAVTLGAQVGVAVPALLVFGRLPIMSIVANLLAVPVAGAVMLYGLPAGLLAGTVVSLAPVLMAPARLGVLWVDGVARAAARLEPPAPWSGVAWAMVAVVVVGSSWARRARVRGCHTDGLETR